MSLFSVMVRKCEILLDTPGNAIYILHSQGSRAKAEWSKDRRTEESIEGDRVVEGEKNERLRMARIDAGFSQKELADAVGATRQTIGLIEAGRYNPSLKLCTAICKTLGKTLNDLFWE
jgi:putative transcriptional regulator